MKPKLSRDWAQAPEEARLYGRAREAELAFQKELRKIDWFAWEMGGNIPRPRWWEAFVPDYPGKLPVEVSSALGALNWGPFGEAHAERVFGWAPDRRPAHGAPVRVEFLPKRLQWSARGGKDAAIRANLVWVHAIWEMALRGTFPDRRIGRLVELCEWVAILPGPPPRHLRDALAGRIESFVSSHPEVHRPDMDRLRLATLHASGDRDEIRRQLADLFDRCDRLGVIHGCHRWELRHHGRLLHRTGQRGAALRCLRLLGDRLSATDWTRQPRLVKRRPTLPLIDPTVATHPLMAGAWLDPENLPALIEVFHMTGEAPWVFGRLHAAFEWQMVMAGREDVLEWINRID